MKCSRITMGLAAVATITMNTVTSAGMSTAMSRNTSMAMTKHAAAEKLILMKGMNTMPAVVKNMSTTSISMEKAVAVGNIITMNTKKAAAANMNVITAITFRVIRRTVSAKSAIRMKNTATCAAKALKTAPAACRTLTA